MTSPPPHVGDLVNRIATLEGIVEDLRLRINEQASMARILSETAIELLSISRHQRRRLADVEAALRRSRT